MINDMQKMNLAGLYKEKILLKSSFEFMRKTAAYKPDLIFLLTFE